MSKFKNMTDWEYFEAQDDFMTRYDAPHCEPIDQLHLIVSREEANEILQGKRKVIVRPFSDVYFNCLTDHNVDKWMTIHRDSFGMDMEAFNEFMCATCPVLKLHLYDEQESWFIDTTCVENALVSANQKNVRDLNNRYRCKDLNRMVMGVESGRFAENENLYYYFVVGDVLGTEKDVPKTKTAKIVAL